MAIQTRYAGDAQGVNNVDATTDGTLGTIVATGLTKSPTALKITSVGTLSASDSGTGGIVESILRQIAIDSTVTMYQVDTDRISVLLEATGSNDATKQTRIRTISANAVVASTSGFKLA
jgi:hypothetical protein